MIVEDSWVWVESPITRVSTNDSVSGQNVSEQNVSGQNVSGQEIEDGWSGQSWCKYIGGDNLTINKTQH